MKKYLFSLSLFASLLLATESLFAQPATPAVIEVTGTASITLTPDEVYISVGVISTDAEASAAMKKVQQSIAEVLKSLKGNKKVKDLNTEYISLQRYGGYGNESVGFRAHQNLSFVLTDLAQYDALLVELLAKGINELGNIQFRSSIAEKQQEKLVAAALLDAKTKATAMAAQYQQAVGKALRISETQGSQHNPGPVYYKSFAEDSNMSSIVGGNLKLEVQVYVQFELK
jgi:uncharacterized protein YggE